MRLSKTCNAASAERPPRSREGSVEERRQPTTKRSSRLGRGLVALDGGVGFLDPHRADEVVERKKTVLAPDREREARTPGCIGSNLELHPAGSQRLRELVEWRAGLQVAVDEWLVLLARAKTIPHHRHRLLVFPNKAKIAPQKDGSDPERNGSFWAGLEKPYHPRVSRSPAVRLGCKLGVFVSPKDQTPRDSCAAASTRSPQPGRLQRIGS